MTLSNELAVAIIRAYTNKNQYYYHHVTHNCLFGIYSGISLNIGWLPIILLVLILLIIV